MKKFSLEGKVAIVTGASSGIGLGCAKMYAEAGAKLLLAARREDRLKTLKAEIEAAGGTAEYELCDVSEEGDCKKAVAACMSKFGRLDILLNNAGYGGKPPMSFDDDFQPETFDITMKVNVGSVFYMTKYAVPEMVKAGGGSIINISSIAALKGEVGVSYTASKGAVKSMTRLLAVNLAKQKIRVNAIYPGTVHSEMLAALAANEAIFEHMRNATPLGRIGEPEDIAYCAVYLASDASSWVTGQDFVIDGGLTCT